MPSRIVVAVLTSALLAIGATSALADGGATKPPTQRQLTAIITAFNAGNTSQTPASCVKVAISKSTPNIGALMVKSTKACQSAQTDTQALVYGNSRAWFTLAVSNTGQTKAPQCAALQQLIGVNAWQDLAGYVSVMGCQNVD
jgi:hypothetical protein